MIDVEEQFNFCVNEIGGRKISELIGLSPTFLNADYLFPQYEVIAELKCLEDDLIKSTQIRNKATAIYTRYEKEGSAPKLSPGIHKVTADGLPESFKHELVELYRSAVHTTVKKSNNQIRATKENLNLKNHHGLLILANNNNTALNPKTAMWILSETFRRYSFSSINSVLYLTANLKARHPEIPRDLFVWIPCHRDPSNKCLPQLLSRLQKSWFKRVNLITGEPVYIYQAEKSDVINDIYNT